MKKENSAFPLYAAFCSLLMLAILFLTLFTLKKSEQAGEKEEVLTAQTEYVYVYLYPDESSSGSFDTGDTYLWIVREHEDRIGIFNSDNVLIHVIETHIKTLPVADRDLLREGIWVSSRKELLAIIEDYTG